MVYTEKLARLAFCSPKHILCTENICYPNKQKSFFSKFVNFCLFAFFRHCNQFKWSNYLHTDYFPNLCCYYHNASAAVFFGLLQVFVDSLDRQTPKEDISECRPKWDNNNKYEDNSPNINISKFKVFARVCVEVWG